MKALSMDAIFSSFGSRVDGSLSFRGQTPELTSEEKVALMELAGKNVKLLIQPTDEMPESVLHVSKVLDLPSQSQRLRSVLYIEWKQKKPDCSFEEHYVSRTNQMIDRIKEHLNPE